MKLSEIKGDRTLDVIADLVEPIANIAMDDKAAALFKPSKPAKGETPEQAFAKRVKKAVPALLKTHKADVVAILATINGVTPQQYAKDMTLATLIKDVMEVLGDEELLAFLASDGVQA
ncbi:MAG: hypothetical protein IJ586_00210 [Alloprevotella sp.]|nr:hypothetical protein [Alloprevotella sp.]